MLERARFPIMNRVLLNAFKKSYLCCIGWSVILSVERDRDYSLKAT